VTPEKIASLGSAKLSVTPVAIPAPAAPVEAGPDWKRIGLWGVLVLGVIFLGWMAIGTLRASKARR